MTDQVPLLDGHDQEDETRPTSAGSPKATTSPQNWSFKTSRNRITEHLRQWRNVYVCSWFIVSLEFPTFFAQAPSLKLMETIICHEVYGNDISEDLCAGKTVQARLATTRGILAILLVLPSLVLGVPYGMLADSKGRRPVAGLTVLAATLCFTYLNILYWIYPKIPFNAIYAMPFFLWIGGGGFVAGSVITAIASEVVPSEKDRTQAFFLLGVVVRVVGAAAPPLGAAVMKKFGPYTAFLLTVPATMISAIPLLMLPETAKPRDKRSDGNGHGPEALGKDSGIIARLKAKFRDARTHVTRDFLPLLRSGQILVGLFATMAVSFTVALGEVALQYIKARYDWDFAKGTWVLTFQAGVHILFLCTLMPMSHRYLTNRYEAQEADLIYSRVSVSFDALGTLLIGLSDVPWEAFLAIVFTSFGIGFGPSLRAYMTALIPKQDIALLYTLMGTAGAIGSLFAAPLLQLCLNAGINLGGMAIGLPFFVSAGVLAITSVMIWCLHVPRIKLDEEELPSEATSHDWDT